MHNKGCNIHMVQGTCAYVHAYTSIQPSIHPCMHADTLSCMTSTGAGGNASSQFETLRLGPLIERTGMQLGDEGMKQWDFKDPFP